MTERFTVFGANGFIGAALVAHLRTQRHEVCAATRDNWPAPDEALGHVIYAAGLTSKFAEAPFETVNAQTTLPAQILENYTFSSFLYLSSTRFYADAETTNEDAHIEVSPTDPQDIYALTKMATECLCLSQQAPTVRVVRLSNVYGLFTKNIVSLAKILHEAAQTGEVEFLSSPQSAKDYVSIKDVVRLLPEIALHGKERVYNLAKGQSVSNREIASVLELEGVSISFRPDAPTHISQPINVDRLASKFTPPQFKVLQELPELLAFARQRLGVSAKLAD